jgi:hypothetical protein
LFFSLGTKKKNLLSEAPGRRKTVQRLNLKLQNSKPSRHKEAVDLCALPLLSARP